MPGPLEQWAWADAWFLASALGPRRNTRKTLDEVIGSGDYINKAIFNKDEVESAVAKLRAAGLIEVRGSGFVVSREVTDIVPKRRPPFEIARHLEEWLMGIPLPRKIEPFVISDEEFQDAVETYRRRFRKWYAKVSEPKRKSWFSLKKR